MESLIEKKIIPKIIRCDRGTENVLLSGIQASLRMGDNDGLSGENSFMYGRSTANQRIEAFWAHLLKSLTSFYIDFFTHMIEDNIFDNSSGLHLQIIRFCFMELIQKELDRNLKEWNLHFIRKSKNADGPHGMPEIMYTVPELFDSEEKGINIDEETIKLYQEIYAIKYEKTGCKKIFLDLINLLLPNIQKPESAEHQFIYILNTINQYLD